MGRKEQLLKQLQQFTENVARDYQIDQVILFGSQATGMATSDSDVDLIIVSADFEHIDSFARATRMYDYWTLDMAVDFICYTPAEFNRLKKRISIVREAIRNGIVVK